MCSSTAVKFRTCALTSHLQKKGLAKATPSSSLEASSFTFFFLCERAFRHSPEVLFQATSNEAIEEATRALTMLGFTKPNVNKAIQTILKKNPSAKVEEIIKLALKMM